MAVDEIVLLTDRPDGHAELAASLDEVAEVCVVHPAHPRAVSGARVVVADMPLRSRASRSVVTFMQAELPSDVPLIWLLRGASDDSFRAAKALGASLSLQADRDPVAVRAAVLALLYPGQDVAEVATIRAASRAGRALSALLETARARGTVDAITVEAGVEPIVAAVHEWGLARWLDTVRTFDDATYQHCLLVAGLAAAFALHLGCAAADRRHLVRAALLHDVGKAAIPLSVLNKPGPLDEDEMALMRGHAAIGHEMLTAAGDFDELTLSVVRHHHEMLDGSGYPDALAGSAIGDVVRLVTICDIYAALIERRPYREPMEPRAAVGILRGMGGKLDGDLVSAFERALLTSDVVEDPMLRRSIGPANPPSATVQRQHS